MIFSFQRSLKSIHVLSVHHVFFHASSWHWSQDLASTYLASPRESSHFIRSRDFQQCEHLTRLSDLEMLIARVRVGSSEDEIRQCLTDDQASHGIHLSHNLIDKLLHRFKDDWKSALGIFKWANSQSGFKHSPGASDMIVDILGKMKQMDKLRDLLEEMRQGHLITLNTIGKVMRRFSGAGHWEDAVRIFDELGTFGLEKNTESMNLLLDTLCKENKVEQARAIFLELKSHISPNAHTFNIFIHGWCKVKRVDEAHWTIQEMKGHGCRPCVISYSTIIRHYCQVYNFNKVYELLDEMQVQGCPPNVVTYTTTMCSMAKSNEFEEALQIATRMRSAGCRPDTVFYNAFIYTLGRASRVHDAVNVFEVEMPNTGVSPNTSTYNSMIAMFCHHAQEQKAFEVLSDMENSGLCKPDVQTYYPLLKSCFKSGKTDTCLSNLLNDMVNKHHLSLDISTYTLLIHGLCRANKCDWAFRLFEEMLVKEIMPRYRTCRLLLDEVKQKYMYEAAERIEDFMKKL
ncbi:Pentatricopeptide repeat-containing protein [Quillaja saponaria]|uniref:Pentatricopeptide repeat-containing protein n=1 Tax=Quillaja saponaria TaxID=32244 RepID=A0AAD7KUT4_QUISA|nr:Pentatricopeptide repeat-containing protein [Quillaja saponaria]